MMEKRNESMKGNYLVLHAKFGPNLEKFFLCSLFLAMGSADLEKIFFA